MNPDCMSPDQETPAAPASPSMATLLQLAPLRGVLQAIEADGTLLVRADAEGELLRCDWLERADAPPLAPGDTVLVAVLGPAPGGVVLGRIGRYRPPQAQARLTLEATESLTLRCGEASVELRADGRAMLKGEDVLLRAKGTQRIRAGHVAIN